MAIPGIFTAASIVVVWVAGGLAVLISRLAKHSRRFPSNTPALVVASAVVATVYLSSSQRLMHLDSQPPVWTAVSLVTRGDFTLDEFRPAIDPVLVQCITTPTGHVVSMYPPGSALALVPFLLPVRLLGVPLTREFLDALVKFAAASWTALSVAILLAALLTYAPRGAWLAAFAYAFGTTAFSSAAQDLWQHGPSQAGLAAALLLLVRPRPSPRRQIMFGAALGWAVVCRTSNSLPALVLFAVFARGGWRAVLGSGAGAMPFLLFTLAYNQATTGAPLLFAHTVHHNGLGFGHNLAAGLLALLFEPSRGLFVYSPFLLLACAGAANELRFLAHPKRREEPAATQPLAVVGMVAAVVLLLLVAQWEEWHGGWSYGYRIISEAALLLTPAFSAAVARWWGRRLLMTAAGLLVGLSIAVHSLHVFAPENGWNAAHLHGTAYHGMWNSDLRDWQIAWHLRAAFARDATAIERGAIQHRQSVPP